MPIDRCWPSRPFRSALNSPDPGPRVRSSLALVLLLASVLPVAMLPVARLTAQPTLPVSAIERVARPPYPGTRSASEIARPAEFVADVAGWLALGRVLWSSGYDQVTGSPKPWPRTVESYGRRFVTRSAQLVAIEVTRHTAAAALGRDPAYVKCSCVGLWRRLGHVTLGTVTDFDVHGQRRVAWPRFLGAAAGSIALGQLQPGQGEAGTVAFRAMTSVGGSWFGNVTKEFGLMPSRAEELPVPPDAPLH